MEANSQIPRSGCADCGGNGWVYVPVVIGGRTVITRCRCNCVRAAAK